MTGPASAFVTGQLVAAGIALFNVLLHGVAAARVRHERGREVNFGATLLSLGCNSFIFYRLLRGDADPLWLRAAGALIFVNFVNFVRSVDSYGQTRPASSRLLHVLALAGIAIDLHGALPLAYHPAGDLQLWWVGPLPGVRMSPLAALWHGGFAIACVASCVLRARQLHRAGHIELRFTPSLVAVGLPAFLMDMAALAGLSPLPPLAGYLPALVSTAFVWRWIEVRLTLDRALLQLRTAQADLVRAERQASVATLVRGIAHELNNPIGLIAGNLEPLREYTDFLVRVVAQLRDGTARSEAELARLTRFSPGQDLDFVARDLASLVRDMGDGARRATTIIGDLQNLTASSQRALVEVPVPALLQQIAALFAPELEERRLQLQVEAPEGLSVTARGGQLEQVLVNLVDNAVRASSAGGRLRLRARALAGDRVELTVEDQGSGMTDEVRARALEPFFSTRAAGQGSGLGLAIVASVVAAHGGLVTLQSAPGQGATVRVELPVRTPAAGQ